MTKALERAAVVAAHVADAVVASASAAWPRSVASREVSRLVGEGFAPGGGCELAFSLSFADVEAALTAVAAARQAGFSVGDLSEAMRGFVTMYAVMPLRAYHLSLALSRLDRVAARLDGYATVIGPVHTAAGHVPRHERALAAVDDAAAA